MAGATNPSETGLGRCRCTVCPETRTVFSVRHMAGAATVATVKVPPRFFDAKDILSLDFLLTGAGGPAFG
jgi:hypothetical protein